MASNPPAACCAKGHRHDGETIGKLTQVDGIDSYVVGDQSSKKVILVLTDVIGHVFKNVQLLADQFAEAGYLVVVPDLFNGDAVPLNPTEHIDFFKDWLPNHSPATVRPIVDKVVAAIEKNHAPTYIASVGYCFGAKYVVQLLGEGKVHAGAVNHPSFVTIDEIKAIKGPLFIAGAETDQIYTEELRHQTEATLKEIKATYFTTLSSGTEHGFSVRGDISDPVIKFAKEKAFSDAVSWFSAFAPKN